MKSKKSIFVVALAALMLIAFTACEQPANIWNPNGKIPTALNITQNEPFVEGQLFDASKFSVEVVYQDGSKETTKSANVTLQAAGDSTSSVLTPGAVVSAKLQTVGTTESIEVSTTKAIDVRTIDSVTVVAPESVLVGSDVESLAIKSLFTVTVNYEGGTLAVKPSEFKLALDTETPDEEDATEPANEAVISVYLATAQTGDALITSDGVPVWIDAEAKTPDVIWTGDIVAEFKDYEDETVNPDGATPNPYVQRMVFNEEDVLVYKLMSDGSKVQLVEGTAEAGQEELGEKDKLTFELVNAIVDGEDARYAATSTNKVNVTYKYVADAAIGAYETATTTASVTTRADYATTIEAIWNYADDDDYGESKAIEEGKAFSKSHFTVTVTAWKSGYEDITGYEPEKLTTSKFAITPEVAPEVSGEDPETTTVTISYVNNIEYTDAAEPVEVNTVYIKPAASN